MKATGAEIKEFWDEWPPGRDWFIEEEECGDSNNWLLDANKKYDLNEVLGVLYWQGGGDAVPSDHPMFKYTEGHNIVPTSVFFRTWKKTRTEITLVVTVPKAEGDELKALCKQRKWKVTL